RRHSRNSRRRWTRAFRRAWMIRGESSSSASMRMFTSGYEFGLLTPKPSSTSQPEPGHDRSEEPSRFLYRLSHPLGEKVVQGGKSLPSPAAVITFDVTNHATRVHVVEALRGKAGHLVLTRLQIESYEREEYLLFSGFDDDGATLDQEAMEKLFGCSGYVDASVEIPESVAKRLE